jgi:hypothetical protein
MWFFEFVCFHPLSSLIYSFMKPLLAVGNMYSIAYEMKAITCFTELMK